MLGRLQKRMVDLDIGTPRWAVPLLSRSIRYVGAKGSRSSGKSHFFAERLVEKAVENPDLLWVCIREIQKSLKFSAKRLVENKIRALGVGHLFDIQKDEIHRIGGEGVILFQGMQDHTADSIKSLEGFDGAWVEEAQSLSARSLELLDPTIRNDHSQLWFSWNPEQATDAVENLFRELGLNPSLAINDPQYGEDCVLVHVNYLQNPWCPKVSRDQANRMKRKNFEKYQHTWLGGYNTKSKSQVFAGYWRVDEFEPLAHWDGPYQGTDFGFAEDPTVSVRCWIGDERVWIEYADGRANMDLDETATYYDKAIPNFNDYETKADNARPESISHLKKNGMPRMRPVIKWPGSVKDGIEWLKSFEEIVIHTRCKRMIEEARLYSYKTNKAGEVLSDVVDSDNHGWDAVRYAFSKLIKSPKKKARVL